MINKVAIGIKILNINYVDPSSPTPATILPKIRTEFAYNPGIYLLMSVEIKIPKDHSKIDVNDAGELIWWSIHLGISPEKLLSIVNKIGPSRKVIRDYLIGRLHGGA
ncbi:MAG: DUF3606 domain-containing protein [Ferruginibacter sp.]